MQHKNLFLICLIFVGAANLRGAEAEEKAAAEQVDKKPNNDVKLTPEEMAKFREFERIRQKEKREAQYESDRRRSKAISDGEGAGVGAGVIGGLSGLGTYKCINYLLKKTSNFTPKTIKELSEASGWTVGIIAAVVFTYNFFKNSNENNENQAK